MEGNSKKGDIYIPRLKYQVTELAPIHQNLVGKDKEAAYWRTDIGVSEQGTLEVEFAPPGPVTWTAGDPVRLANPGSKAQTNDFTAYINEDTSNVTVTLDGSGWTGSVVFKVYEPDAVRYRKTVPLPPPVLNFPFTAAYAGMKMSMTIEPLAVSFKNNQFLESDDMEGFPEFVEVTGSSIPTIQTGGWAENGPHHGWHDAAEEWLDIGPDNVVVGEDTAAALRGYDIRTSLPPSGVRQWKIPCLWRSTKFPNAMPWRSFTNVIQTMTYTSPHSMRVTKGEGDVHN